MKDKTLAAEQLIKIDTLGQLKASGYQTLTVKEELRKNLINKLKAGQEIFPGITLIN